MGMVAHLIEVPVERFNSVKPDSFVPSKAEGPQFEIISPQESRLKKILSKFGLVKLSSDFEVRVLPKSYSHPYDHLIDEAFTKDTLNITDIDKAWDGLHRCLNGGVQEPLTSRFAAKAIMGESQYSTELGMSVHTLSTSCVSQIASELSKFAQEDVEVEFDKLPEGVHAFNGDREDDLKYILDAFETTKNFYSQASRNSSAALVVIV